MKRRPLSSLRWRLLLLVLLALVPSAALMCYTAAEQRRLAAAAVLENAFRMLRPAVLQYERLLAGSEQFLAVLARLSEVEHGDSARASALFAAILPRRAGYANLGLIGADGRLIASALPFRYRIDLSDRAYFRRAVETRKFAVGDYQVGRLTGRATINVAYPILGPNGRVARVLFAALDLAWLEQLAAQAQLAPGSALTLIDRNGTVLVHYPDRVPVGQNLLRLPLTRRVLAEQTGAVQERGPDGMQRLYAFMPLGAGSQEAAAYLLLGIPLRVAYSEADRQLARNLLLLGAVGLLTLLLAWVGSERIVLRQVRALVRAAERLGAGDLSARTGLVYSDDELGRLARAFDEMAASVEAAHRQVLEAEAEKKRFYRELIRAVTHDRLYLTEADAIPREGTLVLECTLDGPEAYSDLRRRLERIARETGMPEGAVIDLMLGVGEAATNAIKHAERGRCSVYVAPDRIIVRVADRGPGIRPENLPATILVPGFSTKVSLGMGYTVMLQVADRLWLATGPEGTVVQIEKWIHPEEHPGTLEEAFERLSNGAAQSTSDATRRRLASGGSANVTA